jgi:nucleoside-diphosphate-sugar epimerase
LAQKKILITGASGFIGTNLLDHFIALNCEVVNFDIKSPINRAHIKYWEKSDVLDYNALLQKAVVFSPDYIIHLAARTDLNGKELDDYAVNTQGVENIIKVSQKIPDLKKIVIASSMLVCSLGYMPKNRFDYHPNTIYGESKVITERIVWDNQPDCDWAIIRPTSIWGPWFDIPYKNFFDMVISKKYFHIGNRSCAKTYGYIGNTVYQIEKILLSDTLSDDNKIFYIGDYAPVNVEQWANEIAELLKYKIVHVPYHIMLVAALTGDVLKKMGVPFPLTTFRLRNMTTDNIVDLFNTKTIAPELPYTRIQGIIKTLEWLHAI